MLEDPWLFVWHLHLALTLCHFVTWVSSYGAVVGGSGPASETVRVRVRALVCLCMCACCALCAAASRLVALGRLLAVELCVSDLPLAGPCPPPPCDAQVRQFDDVIVSMMGLSGWLAVIYFFRCVGAGPSVCQEGRHTRRHAHHAADHTITHHTM
jgi:hypothetical protein